MYRNYVPAPTSERYGLPPVADPLSRGSPDRVICTPPVASVMKGSGREANVPSTLEGEVVAVGFGDEFNPTKRKTEQSRYVLVQLGGKPYVVPLERVALLDSVEASQLCLPNGWRSVQKWPSHFGGGFGLATR